MTIDSGTKIPVSFDPGSVTSAIQLWRDATDMKMPLRDDFKIHFMKNRRKLLEGFGHTANAMSIVLRGMTAMDDAGVPERNGCKPTSLVDSWYMRRGVASPIKDD